ncbi:MAG: AAA-like domain-containing protein [Caldilineaceae bacterium]
MKFFNIGGPCNPDDHYMLPATQRLEPFNVPRLIQQKSYFIVHAPRQTGKTTAMLSLARELTASGDYVSALLSMEVGVPFEDDPRQAELAILSDWKYALRYQLPTELFPDAWEPDLQAGSLIGSFLAEWSATAPRPVVVFLDEIDALQDDALISVLRQLRSGYYRRPQGFPSSLALIGLRDVRDYKVKSGGSDRLNTPSPFNIAVRSVTLRNFTATEVADLLLQHTAESGQLFPPETIELIFHLTQGQPWLVNALAKLCVEELEEDLNKPVLPGHVLAAKEMLILRRQTHLGSLAEKLYEPQVRHVIEPLLAGRTLDDIPLDDIEYLIDLGLVRQRNGSGVLIANPIYKEIIPRMLASVPQASLPAIQPLWLNADGSLNPAKLLDSFLTFWRQHGQPLLRSAPYHEIAPHLVLMAFLHRVVNGEGTIDREYAIGSRRMDLCVTYGVVRMAMELKTWCDGHKDPLAEGLAQLDSYLNGLELETGWLVIFDQRSGLPEISERTTAESTTTPAGRTITLIRA